MGEAKIIENGKCFNAEGDLTFRYVGLLWEESKKMLPKLDHIVINLSKVTRCDSAGMAFLIECERLARQHHKTITFEHIPQQLQNIAKLSQLDSILHVN